MSTASCEPHELISDDVLKRFSAFIKSKKLAHAYLFEGLQGSGKTATALAIARMINCEKETLCNECPSCRKIQSANHPDVVLIAAEEGESIKIEDVRQMIGRSQLKPFEANYKIFILQDIENLSLEASNALLKTLEEPTAQTIVFLTTCVEEKVLPTIRSRCQMVKFSAPSYQEVVEYLQKTQDLDLEKAHFLAHFSQGYPGRAVELYRGGIFDRKNEMIDNIVLQRENGAYLKKILGNQEKVKETLNLLLSWFRDLMVLKSGAQETRIVHRDRLAELLELKSQYSFHQLEEIVDQITNAMNMLMENFNVKIAFTLLQEKIWVRS
ncbi:MAG: DNA polymerase III subunit delta' [Candidatus Omnitrophica bacterium]|nr:DNA polymerase III subunit delta' [Candidatus Omnitrophota bacterium]